MIVHFGRYNDCFRKLRMVRAKRARFVRKRAAYTYHAQTWAEQT